MDDSNGTPAHSSELARRRWQRRAWQSPSDRRRVLASLYPDAGDGAHWWVRFTIMLGLSVVIATLGLSEDSAAIVIGAMLIAPLMTPVLGTSAALVMVWPRRLGVSALAVAAGAAGAVGIAWAMTSLLPAADKVITPEVLARTSPNLRDLLVALAAGAAGAYATAREDVSAALPGVAVAVALVPPLAAAGFTLAAGRGDLTGGALLLFAANVIAIVLAGALVLLTCGFVPAGRVAIARQGIAAGLLAVVVATAAVAVPLTVETLRNASSTSRSQAVNQAVVAWISPYPGLKVDGVDIVGAQVTVDVAGSQAPPPNASLVSALVGVLGSAAAVQVRWFQTSLVSMPKSASSAVLTLANVRPLVKTWLTTASGGGGSTRITNLSINGTAIGVGLAGPTAPAPATSLGKAIGKKFDRTVTVSVSWTLTTPKAQSAVPSPGTPAGDLAIAKTAVDHWITTHQDIEVLHVSSAASQVTVDLAGTSRAAVTPDLRRALIADLGSKVVIEIRFALLQVLKV